MISNKLIAVVDTIIAETDEYNRQHEYAQRVMLTVNRIQRLLYLMDIEHMFRKTGVSMFKEDFCAWPKGPTIPSVYWTFDKPDMHVGVAKYGNDTYYLYPEEIAIIKYILDKTWEWDTVDLNILTKQTGPWRRNYVEDDPDHTQVISKAEIYNWYYNNGMFWEILDE